MAGFNFHGFVHHNYASVVVLTVVLCECLTNLEDEIQYIWLSPWSKTKCTYLFARYYAVAYLIANIVCGLVWPPTIPVPRSKCLGWYLHSMSSFCAQYIASHITLSRRILETYEVRNVGSALLVFHAAEVAGGLVSAKDTLSAVTFTGVCDVLSVPYNVFVFVGMLLLGQLLMWTLILSGFRRRGGNKSSRPNFREMVYQLWCDGEAKIAWAICCLVFVVNTYRGTVGQIVKPVYLFAWPICLLSIGTCRYILSMERNSDIHNRKSSPESNGRWRETQIFDDSNRTGDLPPGCCSESPASVPLDVSNGLHDMRISYIDSVETLSSDSIRWKHPSCLQGIFDGSDKMAHSTNSVSTDLTRRVSTTTTSSSEGTLRRSSISSHITQETEITAPSIGHRSSMDIEIGSLHSSSSATSEELREVWNEVWSGDEHAFIHA